MLMKLADGTMFDTVTKKKVVEESPSTQLAETSFTPKPPVVTRIEELPTDTKQMSVICAILGYRLMGVPDTDICLALGCSFEQFSSLVATEAFTKSNQMMLEAFVAGQTNAARDIIVSKAGEAANTLVHVMHKGGMKEKLAAANSILNRAGVGEDKQEGGMSNGLIIKIVRDADTTNLEVRMK